MNPVIHFEMPAKNRKRVLGFYTKAFGWKMLQTGPEMGNYIVATTTLSGKKGPKKPGTINGGFFEWSKKNQIPSVVIAIDDIKVHMKKIKAAGGRILGKPVNIPTVGWYVSFKDTEGNRVSILQPSSA